MQYTLRELRARKRMTQDDVANLLGISKVTYSKYEKNMGEAKISTALKIADVFDVELGDIFLGVECEK